MTRDFMILQLLLFPIYHMLRFWLVDLPTFLILHFTRLCSVCIIFVGIYGNINWHNNYVVVNKMKCYIVDSVNNTLHHHDHSFL